MKKLLILSLLLLVSTGLYAQSAGPTPPPGATPVAQSATRNDAATNVSSNSTSAQTMTLTPSSGGTVVIYGVSVNNCAGSAAVTAANPTTITTTGFATGSGTNNGAWVIGVGSGTTAGLCTSVPVPIPPTGIRASSQGNVTFVMPTFATNQTVYLQVAWASAL